MSEGRGLWGFLVVTTVRTRQHRIGRLVFVGHGGLFLLLFCFLLGFLKGKGAAKPYSLSIRWRACKRALLTNDL